MTKFKAERSAVETVVASWGAGDPDQVAAWLFALASACDERSQASVAKQLDYSSSVVSQVLSRKYAGDTRSIAEAVQAHLMNEKVDCPAEGQLGRRRCLELQKSSAPPYISGWHARIWRACQTCTNYRGPRK